MSDKELQDLSYIAGLFDGEAHIGYSSSGVGRTKRFVIEIDMASENIINWLFKKYGGHTRFRPAKKEGYKDLWRWRIQGESAISLYRSIEPLLKLEDKKGLA